MKDSKYEEALERARQGLPIDKIFPELYESEDERIRKMLISLVKHHADTLERQYEEDMLAYLERQKEQKPEVKDPFDDEQFCRGYEAGKHDKMREQKPAEWSEEDKEMLDTIIDMVSNSLYEPLCPRANILVWLKAFRSRPKPSDNWKPSEEQMEALMLAIEGKCAPTSYLSRRLEDLYEALANEFHVECKLDK